MKRRTQKLKSFFFPSWYKFSEKKTSKAPKNRFQKVERENIFQVLVVFTIPQQFSTGEATGHGPRRPVPVTVGPTGDCTGPVFLGGCSPDTAPDRVFREEVPSVTEPNLCLSQKFPVRPDHPGHPVSSPVRWFSSIRMENRGFYYY